MAGHSKWHNIQEKKGKTDSQRAKAFTQIARLITMAVKKGGPDQKFNFSLRLAVDKAKAVNMPKDNIERAIKKGTGELAGEELVENRYEGYGPGGVAVMVDTLTDNPTRTVADLKHYFSKYGGNLSGSVAWQFEQKGVIRVKDQAAKAKDEDWLFQGLEAGMDDAQAAENDLMILTPSNKMQAVKEWLEEQNLKVESAQLVMNAKEHIPVTDPAVKEQLQTLFQLVEELDDFQHLWHNAEM